MTPDQELELLSLMKQIAETLERIESELAAWHGGYEIHK